MNSLWKFSPENGKERGLITLYILHSLDKEPKSGYDILKEISQKTEGMWTPSKGTLYPILKSLDDEGLIHVIATGRRAKNIYELTDQGKKTLQNICTTKKESRERLDIFKKLLSEIFGEETISLKSLLMDIKFSVEDLPHEKKSQATAIIEECLEKLRRL